MIGTNELGEHHFSFAVISDTHVNPDDDVCNSPFPVNARANRRFRHVISDLNQRDIEFVLHLGDLVHPVPETGALYAAAAQVYRDIASDLNVPMHILPGNHDIGDTPIKGAPAAPVTQAMIAAWEAEFGPQWGAFSHSGVRFVKLNAQLVNSGLPDEAVQTDWVETEMAGTDERVFLLLHHPPYICLPDEPAHYDNTDPPGREWILDLIQRHGVEAMFAGHAHNFWYDRIGNTDYYLAPATSFVRQDYSEMARTAPPADSEHGRDDRSKLGYFLVNVYEFGHCVQFVRTHGAERHSGAPTTAATPVAPTPRENTHSLIGFDLRHNWAEISEVPPSGGLDEFDRKQVRNDYLLLALIEMGVRDIRIPLADLRDTVRFERLDALKHLGFRPTLFSFGIPSPTDLDLVAAASDRLWDWEMTVGWSGFESDLPRIDAAQKRTGLPIFISRMRDKSDLVAGSTYFHVINHGFSAQDEAHLKRLSECSQHGIVGAVFRLGHQQPVATTLSDIDAIAARFGIRASVHMRMGDDNPALESVASDDEDRLGNAMRFADKTNGTRIFCDTLMSNDRGYFVRSGVIDRCGNPRRLLDVVRHIHLTCSR